MPGKIHYSDDADMFCRGLSTGEVWAIGDPLNNRKMVNFRSDVFVLRVTKNRTAYSKDFKALQSLQILRGLPVTDKVVIGSRPLWL